MLSVIWVLMMWHYWRNLGTKDFITLSWRLETRPIYDFDKMAIKCDLLNFSGQCVLFLINSVLTFKHIKNQKFIIIGWFLISCGKLVNEKEPGFQIQFSKTQKLFSQNIALLLLAGQVSWPTNYWLKRYIQKCTLPRMLILTSTS